MNSQIGINIKHDVNIHMENRLESRHFFVFIWLMYAVVYMTKNCFNAALASIVAEGILTKSQTGVFTSAFYLIYAPLQIVGGLAADRYSPERLIKIGLCGAAIANVVIFFNQNYYVMLAAWILNGIVQFALWPGVFKIVSSQLVRSDRDMMIFCISFSSSFGLLLSYIVGAVIIDWRMNFIVSAVALLLFAVLMELYCRHLNPYMKWDRVEKRADGHHKADFRMSTTKLFVVSGFFVVTVVAFIRCMLDQAVKTLAPIMLMECYENVSPNVGNLCNLLIILFGIFGAVFVKKVLYPMRVRHELKGFMVLLLFALPVSVMLQFVGKISIIQTILALGVSSALLTGGNLFLSYYTNCFVKYGKSATAAGVINAAAALGIVVAGYGFLRIAELWGWQAVTTLWIGMIVAMIILLSAILPSYRKFKEM